MEYIVSVKCYSILGFDIIWYIRKIFSYKKGLMGVCFTLDNNAHKYKSEKTARRAAQAFNGEIKIV
jgi:hypothetical protein